MKMKFQLLLSSLVFFVLGVQAQNKDDIENVHFILNFIDYYCQAYEKQDLPYIEKIFSNDALIITETMELKPIVNKQNKHFKTKKNRKYQQIVKSKQDYLKELHIYFNDNKNKKIVVSCDKPKIEIHNKYNHIYGVSTLQYRKSETNSSIEDQYMGYIFLLIDFRDKKTPIIHIRTWQPQKNIKSDRDKYGLYDFEIL